MKKVLFVVMSALFLAYTPFSAIPQESTVTRIAEGNPPQRRYGIGMAPPRGGEEYITVLMVAEGHLGAEAGLRINDRITHVNGVPVSELASDSFMAAMQGSPLTLYVYRAGEKLAFEMSLEDAVPLEPPGPEQIAAYNDAAIQLATLLERRYLFPEVGKAYAEMLRENAASNRYETANSAVIFAEQLTADLRSVSEDAHLRVLARPGGVGALSPGGADPESPGVRESGWMQDKVAYMRISVMPAGPEVRDWADSFMREHHDARALILDLRMCRGGTLAMMNGFLPYLYHTPTHMLTMEMRPGADRDTEASFDQMAELHRVETDGSVLRWEHWIEPIENARPDLPLYVLTDMTASACEHLTAALKGTDRATVIGATTRGAGHFVSFHEFGDVYSVILPIGRTYDPRTGEGWEGDGIAPHLITDPTEAEAEALHMITSNSP